MLELKQRVFSVLYSTWYLYKGKGKCWTYAAFAATDDGVSSSGQPGLLNETALAPACPAVRQ